MEGYAMNEGTTQAAEVIRLRQHIGDLLRRRVLEAVQTVLEEELSEALGSGSLRTLRRASWLPQRPRDAADHDRTRPANAPSAPRSDCR